MDDEDNGLLPDRNQNQQENLTMSGNNQDLVDGDNNESQDVSSPLVSKSQNACEEDNEEDEEQDQVQMMVRYWRSKSLPYSYLPDGPPIVRNHANNTSIDSGSVGCSSVFCSELSGGSGGGSGGVNHHCSSHSHHSSRSRTCNYNDPGCKPGTCSGNGDILYNNPKARDNNLKKIKNGDIKTLGGGGGGGSSGPSGEQESGEGKRRMDWRTLQQHYYPEGGWGWVVTFCALFSHALALGIQLYLSNVVFQYFKTGWLGSVSMGVSMFLSPLFVSICKRKSTRLSAVFGGLIASLGCLFTSFATQLHQVCISYGAFTGVGVGLVRDSSTLMVGQYFKRRRDLVEMFVVAGSGLGILLMAISINSAISSLGWRLGLQAVTGSLFLTFFLGTCYRSASLYHPQRRAILHLKNQKRKIKDKEKREEKPPFIDFKCLRSRTLQILLVSTGITSTGINAPLFHLALECEAEGEPRSSLVTLHIYIGVAWILGCFLFGLMVIQKNQECRVSKQYLTQMASVICGISIVALTAVEGYGGLVIFCSVYGFFLGGYNYALKVYTYERVRRHFPRAWSFVQWSQSFGFFFGVPLSGYMNAAIGWKSGYYFSAFAVFLGSGFLFLTDVRRRRLSRRKTPNSSMKTNETTESVQSPKMRRLSFSYPLEQFPTQSKHDSDGQGGGLDPALLAKELTCISEEGLADMDFQDIYFDEWAEYFGECITSCNKVENCLASEYDPDLAVMVERRARRWSAARPSFAQQAHAGIGTTAAALAGGIVGVHNSNLHPPGQFPYPHLSLISGNHSMSGHEDPLSSDPNHPPTSGLREIPVFRRNPRNAHPPRSITVIDEASV